MNSIFIKSGAILILSAFISVCFADDILETYQDKGLYGFHDEEGEIVIAAKYQEARDFNEGMAAVKREEKWGYIDVTGKAVVPFLYDWAGGFSEGKAVVKLKDKYLCIDRNNNILFSGKHGWGPFKNGITSMSFEGVDGEVFTKYIDTDGKDLFTITGSGESFSEGLAAFSVYDKKTKKTKYGVINIRGKTVVDPKYSLILNFSEGLAAVQNDSGLWGFIDFNGKLIIDHQFNEPGKFVDGVAILHKGGKLLDGSEIVDYEGGNWWKVSNTGALLEKIENPFE